MVEQISDMIRAGEDNAVHLRELVKRTGLSGREVRSTIEDLRIAGDVIIANENGYFRPDNTTDLRRWINQESARAASVLARTVSAADLLKKWERGEDG